MYNANNSYIPMNYNPQANIDRINNQIAELEKLKSQIPQQVASTNNNPPSINQTFQLAPNNSVNMRYANNIEEVQKEIVIADTPFFSKDLTVVWIKNQSGEIKSYEMSEIIARDEKDIQIELLQQQINELRKEMLTNEQYTSDDTAAESAADTTERDETIGTATKKSKSGGVSKISRSKTK